MMPSEPKRWHVGRIAACVVVYGALMGARSMVSAGWEKTTLAALAGAVLGIMLLTGRSTS